MSKVELSVFSFQSSVTRLFLFVGVALAVAVTGVYAAESEEPVPGIQLKPGQMTLDECIAYALKHSPELKQHQIDHENQILNTIVEKGKFSFQLSTKAERTNTVPHHDSENGENKSTGSVTLSKEVPGWVDVSTTFSANDNWATHGDNTGSLSLSISRVILGGGSRLESRFSLDNSMIDELIKLNSLNRFRRELAFKVKKLYYSLIRSRQTLRIRELKLKQARKNLEHAIERERPLDIASARIDVPRAEEAELRARRSIDSSLDELKRLIGMELAEEFDTDTKFDFKEEKLDVGQDTTSCFANDEGIINASLEHKKAVRETKMLRSRVLPEVKVSATTTHGSDEGVNVDGDVEHKVGITMSWDLGRKADQAKYRKAENTVKRRELAVQIMKQEKEKKIRDLARRLDEALRLISIQKERVKLSKRRVALYLDRWENGEVDILEYLRSQDDHENSKIELINQNTQYMELLGEYRFVTAAGAKQR